MYWPQAKFLTVNSMPLNRQQSQLSGAAARSSSNLRSLSSSAAFYAIITKVTAQLACLYFTMKKYCAMKKIILTLTIQISIPMLHELLYYLIIHFFFVF
jgi:hypothetical protein